ncbi:acyl-CoA thioesterase [Pseudomonas sp. CDFA 602]|uniref:acyl-CoA thioesterase n=1 Tax=Pseudomonas californiensis TaxID=2829823 RepID=UPI001E2E7DC8|nr:thioesterase family protein [Pseudomonas californiensis]MCD5995986.1 acyl-CoA thioesterase [Pseudomonas californiensis]MCD6001573.1 acyl-CoA thioesterase [Pseudomonas californiensis]
MPDQPPQRHDFPHFHPITTRWTDNDVYGQVSSVTYYSFFDSAVNAYLIARGGLDIHDGGMVAFVVSSSCDYFASVAYPELIEVGVKVSKLGGSSVQYEMGVFKAGEDEVCAVGQLVHVFVDRASGQPMTMPAGLSEALQRLIR